MFFKKWLTNTRIKRAEQELELWEIEKSSYETLEKIKEEKYNIRKKRLKLSTTKWIIIFLLVNCTIIEIYALWVMVKLQDLSVLAVLITSIIGETFSFAIYAIKALRENTKGGITYDLAMMGDEDETDFE